MSESEIAINVQHLSKTFKLPHEKATSIKGALINITRHKRGFERQHVLSEISFDIKRGEFFGIVGRNGSGKSTLLKLLAGIYTPDKGEIRVNGKLTPFIELGVGFNPELTGRENVFLNGALLGFNRREMESMYHDIVAFAELERFMDQKLKNYSSGMQVRLAFSIAIRAESDILLIDEVLAVGDMDFQQKCYEYFYELKNRKQTVVIVTHDMGAVRKFCDQGIVIGAGEIVASGKPDTIAKTYEKMNLRLAEERLEVENEKHRRHQGNGAAIIKRVETFNPSTKKKQNTFLPHEDIGVRIVFEAKEPIEQPAVGFIFQDAANITVFATNNHILEKSTKDLKAGQQIILESVVGNVFTDGRYTITCAIESTNFATIYDRIEFIHAFMIGGHALAHATTHPDHTFLLKYTR